MGCSRCRPATGHPATMALRQQVTEALISYCEHRHLAQRSGAELVKMALDCGHH
ncbi:hypothetical protein [Streptomyces longwoodensis]|uniref:hypothetical protein n=1 Tax=Streptomyces longwoodensis TaxID=68231 RepID=UPI0033C2AEC1